MNLPQAENDAIEAMRQRMCRRFEEAIETDRELGDEALLSERQRVEFGASVEWIVDHVMLALVADFNEYPEEEGEIEMVDNKVTGAINSVGDTAAALIPTVTAVATLVRLIATVVQRSNKDAAAEFDPAIKKLDDAVAGLKESIAGFEAAKATALANAAQQPGPAAAGGPEGGDASQG